MTAIKPKSIQNIEERMEGIDRDSLRYQILESAKNFKTSWINLAQALYSVWKDKIYKEWGYTEFDTYTAKEIGVRKETTMKLLRSYYFLEKEEPMYLQKTSKEAADASSLPSFESVYVLRKAKNSKLLDESDYQKLKKDVLENGRDAKDVRRDLTTIIKQHQELQPEEARNNRKSAALKRLIGVLKSIKRDVEIANLLNASTIKDVDKLISKLESEIK